ncbi:MAG: TrkA family potassium uptake protein [Methanocellales archaeon]|nr:TrkA family potassium uptake protein [Methanocellales archaeon]MDD3421588.1 TrkA family potassium uptake protein [Methanocellales archaeon]MDD4898127.1 TrkA family potassium uptake protein [Methanocellales archaeon]MDD5447176.1 TrkA family potassium uptake protein [Methanocellales archaeon]
MYIVIVGGGRIGTFLASTLSKEGEEVVLIESDKEICQNLAEKLDILVINGDGTDAKYLEDAGAKKADVFVAVTGEDKVNLVSCQMAKKNFDVPRTIARVNEPKNESVFESLGIDVAISSVTAVSMIIKNAVTSGKLTTLLTLKEGNVELVELHVPEDSPAINRTIKDLCLPDECILTAIIRQGHLIFPKGGTVIEMGDLIVALTTAEHIDELKKTILGTK